MDYNGRSVSPKVDERKTFGEVCVTSGITWDPAQFGKLTRSIIVLLFKSSSLPLSVSWSSQGYSNNTVVAFRCT